MINALSLSALIKKLQRNAITNIRKSRKSPCAIVDMTSRLRFSAAHAYRHLRNADPILGTLIREHGPFKPRPSADPYGSLLHAILFQQLAGPAARAIQNRWYSLYGDKERPPPPSDILSTSDEQFRSTGVSRQKASYLRDLATHVDDGRIDFEYLATLPDDEVSTLLMTIRGIGEWSAHMFLMFELGRPDVLPIGDLGVRRGMQVSYQLRQIPTPSQARELGMPWKPYRSVGSWYMWRAADTIIPGD